MLKWFVGSSKRSTSGFANKAAAKATRTRQPPLNSAIVRARSASEKPKLTSSWLARSSAVSASIDSRCEVTASRRAIAFASALPSSSAASARSSRRSTSASNTAWTGVCSIAAAEKATSCET
mmetsp:Transcript_43907/g.110288  ORF Transcript_43907/g.110288 Transcript_43907/m.110288 type:complete len:122 (-) Transcript_43907:705-1070(-)